jgi:hypothetical protein
MKNITMYKFKNNFRNASILEILNVNDDQWP